VGIAGCNNNSINRDDEVDNDLLSIEEILGPISRQGILTGGDRNAEAALQDLDKLALDASGSRIGPNSQYWIIVQATARALEVCATALHRYSKQSPDRTQIDW
jgi:hypothetical protein